MFPALSAKEWNPLHTKRFAGDVSDAVRISRLLALLDGKADRTAQTEDSWSKLAEAFGAWAEKALADV